MNCYSSRIGCLIYFDDIEYDRCLCEPSTLFLLGIDAVTTPSDSYSIEDIDGNVVPNEKSLKYLTIRKDIVGDLYDKIIYYLSLHYNEYIQDDTSDTHNDEKTFDVNNLKVFMNRLTGTHSDRIVPIIFHECDSARLIKDIDSSDAYNDLASRIQKIFNFAGYDVADNELPILGKPFITDQLVIDAIDNYNKELKTAHEEKQHYRHYYKVIDYKAMYLYALGVLYGCKCLGYPEDLIWQSNPSEWYVGESAEYTNLVNTAYTVFRFHYSHPIKKIDSDKNLFNKYKAIQLNCFWNFDNSDGKIKPDEKHCTVLSIEDNSLIERRVIYSRSTGPQKPIPGSYFSENAWLPLDSSVICSDPKRGIVHNCDKSVTRYIGHNKVEIKQAYQYASHKYLSPTIEETSFISDGNLGWVNFDYDSYKKMSDEYAPLTFVEKDFSELPQSKFNNVISKETGSVVGCYESDISDEVHLYGIMSDRINSVDDTWNFDGIDPLFTTLLSESDFNDKYYTEVSPDGYTLTNYYDLSRQVSLYINNDNPEYYFDGNEDALLVDKGYTLSPSASLDAYVYDTELNLLNQFNLRYNEDLDAYWSSEWDPKEWLSDFDSNIYINTGSSISLYRNVELLFDSTATYYNNVSTSSFICNTTNTSYDLSFGFIKIDSLYNKGITSYECEIVEEDPYGNPLVDLDGSYIAWYDSKVNKYWNGYIKQWQDEVPTKAEELPHGEMTLYLIPPNEFWNGNYSVPTSDGTAKPASVTCFGVYGNFTATAKLRGTDGNSLSFTIQNYYGGSKSVTIYYDGVQVFSRMIDRLENVRLDEIGNDYITFSGNWPYWGGPNGSIHSRTYYLLCGLDESSVQGIPLYYEDGTQAKISDYIPYKIISVNRRIYNRIGSGWGYMEKVESNADIDASKLSFVSDSSGNLLLSYSGDQHITAMRGFIFSWAYNL